jgi:hypothetical protein
LPKLKSKSNTNNFAIVTVLIFATLLILTSSLIFASFTPTSEGQKPAVCKYTIPEGHCNDHYEAIGRYATLKINTNLYLDSDCGGTKKCPNNADMNFWLQSSKDEGDYVSFWYDDSIRGSPDTISLQVPVAPNGKTDYSFKLATKAIPVMPVPPVLLGFWKPGDESVKSCSGQLTPGAVATCTVSINWGWYPN